MRPDTAQFQHPGRLGTQMVVADVKRQCVCQVLPHMLKAHARQEVIVDNLLVGPVNKKPNDRCEHSGAILASYNRGI